MSKLPIRKVAIGFVAMGIAWGLRRIGVDLGPESINEAAVILVGSVTAYAVKDPRVVKVEDVVSELVAEAEKLIAEAEKRGQDAA